jgi:hypothetical protein
MYWNNNVKVSVQYLAIVLPKLVLFFYMYQFDAPIDYQRIVVLEYRLNVRIIVLLL